jgi:hypothetical protein
MWTLPEGQFSYLEDRLDPVSIAFEVPPTTMQESAQGGQHDCSVAAGGLDPIAPRTSRRIVNDTSRRWLTSVAQELSATD